MIEDKDWWVISLWYILLWKICPWLGYYTKVKNTKSLNFASFRFSSLRVPVQFFRYFETSRAWHVKLQGTWWQSALIQVDINTLPLLNVWMLSRKWLLDTRPIPMELCFRLWSLFVETREKLWATAHHIALTGNSSVLSAVNNYFCSLYPSTEITIPSDPNARIIFRVINHLAFIHY